MVHDSLSLWRICYSDKLRLMMQRMRLSKYIFEGVTRTVAPLYSSPN